MTISGHIVITGGELAVLAKNVITDAGRDAVLYALAGDSGPGWSHIGFGVGTAQPGSSDAALSCEVYRRQITSSHSPGSGTARFCVVVPGSACNGHLTEFAIFDCTDRRAVLSDCESTSGWTSGGTLSLGTANVHAGTACLVCSCGSHNITAFQATGLSPSYGGASFGTADYLQFWLRSTNAASTYNVRVGSGTAHYYLFDGWTPGTADEYELFHQQIGSGSVVGTPNINAVAYFRVYRTAGGSATDMIDAVSLFGTAGGMMTRGTFSYDKAYGEQVNIYYTIMVE